MECKICGKTIPENSKYCQRCGSKIEQKPITVRELKEELLELKESSDNEELAQYYNTVLETVGIRPFQKVKYTYVSALDEKMMKNLVDEDGNLHIPIENMNMMIQLTAAYLINERDSLYGELSDEKTGRHDDRLACIEAAYDLYERNETDNAIQTLSLGSAQIKKEINRGIEYFSELPRSTIKKLFCGKSIKTTNTTLNLLHEAFDMYLAAVRLSIVIDAERENTEGVLKTIEKETAFLKQCQNHYGFQRVLEYDDENSEDWKRKALGLKKSLLLVNERLKTNSLIFEIKGENDE